MRSYTSWIVVDTFCEEGVHLRDLLTRISRIIVLAIHSIISDMTFPLSYWYGLIIIHIVPLAYSCFVTTIFSILHPPLYSLPTLMFALDLAPSHLFCDLLSA